MSTTAFDDLSDAYEAMIDWPRRLAHEEPFYRWLVERGGAKTALDTACGTGHHAELLHSWGLNVQGADLSQSMIERCRRRLGESQTLSWAVRGFDQDVPRAGSFDLAICMGNSLALASSREMAAEAVAKMLGAVRRGGAVAVHVVNLWRLDDGPSVWQKCVRAPLPQGESLIVKGIHRCAGDGYVDFVIANLAADPPALRSECVRFRGFQGDELQRIARQAGAGQVELYGGYRREAYVPHKSQDLIVVAIR